MGSEQSEGTSYQPSEPKPCANNCGFFGTAGTMNLCSKCYRDFRVKEEQAASAKAAVEKSFSSAGAAVSKQPENQAAVASGVAPQSFIGSSSSPSSSTAAIGGDRVEPKAANRCLTCNRKVGLTGFKCKCGSMFCGMHRYPEKHVCTFDFKIAGREAIAKANPVVKADKIQRL